MARYILRRLAYSAVSLFLLSLTIFLFVRITGDPTTLLVEPGASQADIDAVRQRLGLDRSIWVQYASFMASLAEGATTAEILEDFPTLTEADVRAAIAFEEQQREKLAG